MLEGGDEHRGDAKQDERDADVVREVGGGREQGSGLRMLGRDEAKEQAESRDDKAEPHDGQAAPDPRQECALGCEEDAWIGHCALVTYAAQRYQAQRAKRRERAAMRC